MCGPSSTVCVAFQASRQARLLLLDRQADDMRAELAALREGRQRRIVPRISAVEK